jgi:hypothetical protein
MAELKKLQSPAVPNLPLAPTTYGTQHFDILNNVLRLYFNQLNGFTIGLNSNIVALNIPSSGTTAARPTTSLQVGQMYFDITLGIPIWWDGTNWVDATGTTV